MIIYFVLYSLIYYLKENNLNFYEKYGQKFHKFHLISTSWNGTP